MFVDVDYPELMKKKRDAIISSPQLQEILQPLTVSIAGPILLRSTNYTALGCDLADTKELGTVLDDVFDTSKCSILCTAEVSITYMGVEAADSLIAWAAHYDDSMSNFPIRASKDVLLLCKYDSVCSNNTCQTGQIILSRKR